MDETERHKTIPNDDKISRLLGSLGRVDAPKDFEHRLKARIANDANSPRTARKSNPILAFAVPVSLLVLLGIFLYVSDLISPTTGRLEDVVVSEPINEKTAVTGSPEIAKAVQNADEFRERASAVPAPPTTAHNRAILRSTATRKSSTQLDRESGNSIVLSATQPERPILPPGINPQRISPEDRPPGFDRQGKPTIDEVFELIGIETVRAVSGVTVRSVRRNGIADRSGVRSGDLVEAIDDRPINETTTFEDGSTLKTVRVRRDGRQVVLQIKN